MTTRIDELVNYPYRRIERLLGETRSDLRPLIMHLGEPKFGAPSLVAENVAGPEGVWSSYPAITGTQALRSSVAGWLERRFAVTSVDAAREVHPVTGTREGLFQIAMAAVMRKEAQLAAHEVPVILSPNPLYHPYFGGALFNKAEFYDLPLTAENGFKPDFSAVPADILRRAALAYICTPGNPTSRVMTHAEIQKQVDLAREYDFILASDECYSEIYYDDRPNPGVYDLLESDRSNVVMLNSLSKRSASPGLRSGFIAGDPEFIDLILLVRAYIGAQVPGGVQTASAALWNDEAHVEGFRQKYAALRSMADRALAGYEAYSSPEGAFFLWLNVGDGAAFARRLWQEKAVKALPGEIMARPSVTGGAGTPGDPFIRLPLIYSEADTEDMLDRVTSLL